MNSPKVLVQSSIVAKMMSFAILVPHTTILGNSDLFIEAGSTINLTCIIQAESMRDTHIYWNYEGKVIQMKYEINYISLLDFRDFQYFTNIFVST